MAGKALETDWELDVARPDNVLDLEVCELCVEAELLNDTSVLARGKLRIVFRLCASDHHLARSEDQCCSFWLSNTHDDGGKTLEVMFSIPYENMVWRSQQYLWVVFCVACMQRNRLEVQTAIEIDRGDDVSLQIYH